MTHTSFPRLFRRGILKTQPPPQGQRKIKLNTKNYDATIDVCGDTLGVTWTGDVWQASCNGSQHAREWDALAEELRDYMLACGDDVSEVDGQFVRDNYEIVLRPN